MVAINALDDFFLFCFHPNTEWKAFLQDSYKGLVNLATLSDTFAYINETIGEGWFSQLFMLLSIVSLIQPSILASLLAPVLNVFSGVTSAL